LNFFRFKAIIDQPLLERFKFSAGGSLLGGGPGDKTEQNKDEKAESWKT
jgi:hypothetical protein